MNGQFFLFPIILLLLGICGPANQAAENQTAQQQPPATALPLNATEADLQTWSGINTANVEAACLAEAKVRAGDLAWAVKSCTCVQTLGEGVKDYKCGISTMQGTVMGSITCVLANSTCTLQSAYGNSSMTFEQIREFQAQK